MNHLSSDPQTAEDILRASTEHLALVTLKNGDTITCYGIAVRKDTTHWHGFGKYVSIPTDSVASISGDRTLVTLINGLSVVCYDADYHVLNGRRLTMWITITDVSVPTDSVASIRIADPQPGAIALGFIVGGVVGGIIGNALFVPTPPTPWVINFNQLDQVFAIVLGVLAGAAAGGGAGSIISSTTEALYTSDSARVAPDTATPMVIPSQDTASVVPDTRVRKWVPDGYSTGFSQGHWEYIPNDTIHSPDSTQIKLPH
jgi:hypothetical protein